MSTLADRLSQRFEEEICRVCVLRTASADCSLEHNRQCPVFRWARELATLVETIDSVRIAEYVDELRAVVCPECAQDDKGACRHRKELDCPLEMYFPIVVRILEEELEARPPDRNA